LGRISFGIIFWVTLLLTVGHSPVIYAADMKFPALSGRVVDQANLLSSDIRNKLASDLEQHEKKTSNQFVITTVSSLQGRTIEEFGYQLGRHWQIGQEGKNNGALLIVAPTERKVRIEVGYGLEGTLTDAQAKMIIENVIIPEFKAGSFPNGIIKGTAAILGVLNGSPYKAEPIVRKKDNSQFMVFLFGAAVILIVAWHRRKERVCSRSNRVARHDSHGNFGGGGFSNSSSGGGFSGGGGGGFGGGGSSGGW